MSNGSASKRGAARLFAHAGPAVLSVSALVLAWEAYVRLWGVSPTALPAPSRVLVQGFEQREALAGHTLATLQATLFGFSSSLCAAFLFSFVRCGGPCSPCSSSPRRCRWSPSLR
jgi:ABC-type nitrate/sulfonate/bicarbonate transport system permease component